MTLIFYAVCLAAGVAIGRLWCHFEDHRRDRKPPEKKTQLLTSEGNNGEVEVDRVVVEPSPLPPYLAAILVLLGLFVVGSTIIQRQHDSSRDKREARSQLQINVGICENQAGIILRQREAIEASAQLGRALDTIISSKDPDKRSMALRGLRDYSLGRIQASQQGLTLPLTVRDDCRDGKLDYPPTAVAPPATPVPQTPGG